MIRVATYDGKGYPVLDAHSKFKFPAGELQVTVNLKAGDFVNVFFEFENVEEIVELLLIADAVKRVGGILYRLDMPYVPFGRQDRAANKGEALSLKVFADLINSLQFAEVCTIDPHSDVTTALIDNLIVTPQEAIMASIISNANLGHFWLVSPDSGATKKIHKTAKAIGDPKGIIECSKIRDTTTGEIRETVVHSSGFYGDTCVIIDDICDGGKTFTEIAKVLKKKNAGKVVLIVSHGLFTKGFSVFDGLIDEIYTRKGKVYPR